MKYPNFKSSTFFKWRSHPFLKVMCSGKWHFISWNKYPLHVTVDLVSNYNMKLFLRSYVMCFDCSNNTWSKSAVCFLFWFWNTFYIKQISKKSLYRTAVPSQLLHSLLFFFFFVVLVYFKSNQLVTVTIGFALQVNSLPVGGATDIYNNISTFPEWD